MFEFIKNLFVNKTADETTIITAPPAPCAPAAMAPKPAGARGATQVAETAFRARNATPPPASRPAAQRPAPESNETVVHLSLESVLSGLPFELKGRVRNSDAGATVAIPVEQVLAQLSQGAVRISFGDLRRSAPKAFTSAPDSDQTLVTLPLNEILSQINPSMLGRRQNQKHVEVPEEISSPFADRGQGLEFTATPARTPDPATSRSVTPAAPIQPRPAPPRPAPANPIQSVPVHKPIPAAPFKPAPFQPAPLRSSLSPTPPAPAPAAPPAAPPTAIPIGPAIRNLSPTLAPNAAQNLAPAQPIRVTVPQSPKPSAEGVFMTASLAALSEAWPDALRQEIIQMNLGDAKVALPAELVEESLKRGRISFPWKTVRSWIRPAPLPAVSAHDNVTVDLPLKVIMPLFLSRKKEAAGAQQRVAVDESIPNLFFGFPQPEAASAPVPAPVPAVAPAPAPAPPHAPAPARPGTNGGTTYEALSHAVAKPMDTNYYVWDESAGAAKADEPGPLRATPGTTFASRYATPNEVVSRAAALEGVSGVLVALPDGLMVASKLSPDLNGDTLAAFLPHIFGKVSQCTKELRMGELNNLNFTVGNVPWKIFRVNAIFFAAFGRVGEPLPTAQLAALAGELDHKK